jgi:hypothetical protein
MAPHAPNVPVKGGSTSDDDELAETIIAALEGHLSAEAEETLDPHCWEPGFEKANTSPTRLEVLPMIFAAID